MVLHVGKDKVKLRHLWSYGVREMLRASPISAGIDIFPPRKDPFATCLRSSSCARYGMHAHVRLIVYHILRKKHARGRGMERA